MSDSEFLPVNLDNLRDMTGGDPALEAELFQVYLNSSEECRKGLRASCVVGAEAEWKTQAHSWKGMSLNLGAEKLGRLCAEAQNSANELPEKRVAMLAAMEEEFEKVRRMLEPLCGK